MTPPRCCLPRQCPPNPPTPFPHKQHLNAPLSSSLLSSARHLVVEQARAGDDMHGRRQATAAAIHCGSRRPPEEQLPLHASHPGERAPVHGLQARPRLQGHTDELYGGCSCKERLRSLNKDTCPNLQLILKGFLSRLKSKLVLQQPPRSKTLSSASRSTNYKINDTLNVQRTPERTNLERAEREQLGRLLEEERTSRLELEKNMMAKFAELSQQMGTQQVPMKRVDNKENSNPNLQNILLQRSSPNKTPGSRPTTISSNALIQAAARHSRMFKAMDPKN